MSGYYDLEQRRAEVERHRENSARNAIMHAEFTMNGQGTVEFPDVVDFGLTFIEQPMVSVGVVADMDAIRETLDVEDSVANVLPIVSGFVVDWDEDDRGFFVGAWCAASVYYPPTYNVPITATPEFTLHFTFHGIAIKDVPVDNVGN